MADPELRAEQAYLEWAIRRIDQLIADMGTRAVSDDAAVNRTLKKMRAHKAAELEAARDRLLIGRLDCIDSSTNPGTWYVGRTNVDGIDNVPAVVDWRTEFGALFYQADRSTPEGVGRRRSFVIDARRVVRLSDDTLISGFKPPRSQLDVAAPPVAPAAKPKRRRTAAKKKAPETKAETQSSAPTKRTPAEAAPSTTAASKTSSSDVRAADILLEELDRSRSGTMHDIVATIQADQDRFIRANDDTPLILQGGPGTGKTVVGLHRAAYILFQQRERGGDQSLLVIGPNPTFMRYVSSVLPSLGEGSSQELAIDELSLNGLSETERRRCRVATVDSDIAHRVKGGSVMAQVVRNAIWASTNPRAITCTAGLRRVQLTRTDVQAVLDELRRSGDYDTARKSFATAVSARAVAILQERSTPTTDLLASQASDLAESIRKQLVDERVTAEVLPPVKARNLIQRLMSDVDLLAAAASGLIEPADQQALLTAPAKKGGSIPLSPGDLPLIDEVLVATGTRPRRFDHVVVDEAQDLTPMQWRVVRRRTRGSSITILGDLAQGTSVWSPSSWDSVIQFLSLPKPAAFGELTRGYRVPAPIVDLAATLLPIAAPLVGAPQSFRDGDAPAVKVTSAARIGAEATKVALSGNAGSTAIIAPRDLCEPIRKRIDKATADTDHIVDVLDPDEAKGLEWDNVIVCEPAEIAMSSVRGHRRLYVALTRSTKRLTLLHSSPLPAAMHGGEIAPPHEVSSHGWSDASRREIQPVHQRLAFLLSELRDLRELEDELRQLEDDLLVRSDEMDQVEDEVRSPLSMLDLPGPEPSITAAVDEGHSPSHTLNPLDDTSEAVTPIPPSAETPAASEPPAKKRWWRRRR